MVMLSGVKFGRAFIEWGQPFRLCHMTSGMYLGVESNEVILIDGSQADQMRTSFSFVRKSVSYACRALSHAPTQIYVQQQIHINFSLVFSRVYSLIPVLTELEWVIQQSSLEILKFIYTIYHQKDGLVWKLWDLLFVD